MRSFIISGFIGLLLGLMLSSSQNLLSQSNEIEVKVVDRSNIDLCGDRERDKEVFLLIDIGSIAKSDSLYGFNLEISYDPEKVKINQEIATNTLSWYFDYKDVNVLEEGRAVAFGANLLGPMVYGDRALIGILGEYIGLCPDTTTININYIEFTEEFQKTVGSYVPAVLNAVIKDKPERSIDLEFDKDTLMTFEDSLETAETKIYTYSDARLENIDFELTTDINTNFEIAEINSVNENILIDDIQQTSNTFTIKTSIVGEINAQELFSITVKKKADIDAVEKFEIKAVNKNECACITRMTSAEVYLKSKKEQDTTSTIDDNNKLEEISYYYDQLNEKIVLTNLAEDIKSISVYDINGIKITSLITEMYKKEVIIDMAAQPQGMYLLILTKQNKIISNKLIKY